MRFSIVTVCLNPGLYLEETVRSVLQQDIDDFEYLLVDGGSTDGSMEVIRAYAAADSRVRWSSLRDDGISDAMNRGVRDARGEIVAFLHADDRYADPAVLGDIDSCFSGPLKPLWVTGGMREIDADGREICQYQVRKYTYRRLLRNNIIFHPATFVRRDVFEKTGLFDGRLRYAMDYDLWLRLGRLSPPCTVDRVVADFRAHAGSVSTANSLATLQEEYAVRRRYARGWAGRLGHAFYHFWRRQGWLIR